MQTFLPYSDFLATARVLDYRRLGKQRVEVLQILGALLEGKGWRNHPATRMWEGHESGLAYYGVIICKEWKDRGYKDTCMGKIMALADPDSSDMPRWMGWSDFHISHQSMLVQKAPDHYRPYFPNVPEDLEYIWPTGISTRLVPTSTR